MSDVISMTWPQYWRCECSYRGRVVRLWPKSSELLSLLLMRRGQIVPHIELIECLWPDPDRSPELERKVLQKHIWFLRQHFPGLILNTPGWGYWIPLPEQIEAEAA